MAQLEIAEAEFVENLEFADDGAFFGKEGHRFLDGEFEHFGDVPAVPRHFESFFAIAKPFAGGTNDLDIRHERKLRHNGAITRAFFATATLDVKAEGRWGETA